jgi:hypothetical protein
MPVRKSALPLSTVALAALSLAACGNVDSANLLFYQQQNVGLNIGVNPASQSANLNLGFDDQNYAIVPVAVKQADGNYLLLKSKQPIQTSTGDIEDALSVLGQFGLKSGVGAKVTDADSDTDANAGGEGDGAPNGTAIGVGLHKFFATGGAARNLSHGYMDKLGGYYDESDTDDESENN